MSIEISANQFIRGKFPLEIDYEADVSSVRSEEGITLESSVLLIGVSSGWKFDSGLMPCFSVSLRH